MSKYQEIKNEFYGFYIRKLDNQDPKTPKHRLSIPKKFREVICERNRINLNELISENKLVYNKQFVYYNGLLVHNSDVPDKYSRSSPLTLEDNISPPYELNARVYFCKISKEDGIRIYASLDWMMHRPIKMDPPFLYNDIKSEGRVIITPVLNKLDMKKKLVEIYGRFDYFTIKPV